MMTKSHYFFIFKNSPWPLLTSLNLMSMFMGVAILLKYSTQSNLACSLGVLLVISLYWWNSYSGEINLEGMDSSNLEDSIKFAMLLFISSEIFFFLSFFWSYFHFFLAPTFEMGLQWPPLNLEMFNFYGIPLLNTVILLSSGMTMTMSHYYFNMKWFSKSLKNLLVTFLLGITFSLLQLKEYNSSFFSVNDSTFGSSFFLLTGFHGLHVMIGATFIFIVFLRSNTFNSVKNNVTSFELSAWYWHFVDVIWIFLYFLIYYMNNI